MNFRKVLYQVRNWKSHYRALVMGTATTVVKGIGAGGEGPVVVSATLNARVIRARRNQPTGWFRRLFWQESFDLGMIARRVVTTAGVKFLCDDFNAGAKDLANMKFHAMGTGTAAEAASDTALGAEVEARVAGSQASAISGANATYTTVATITATAARAITEHGLFDQLDLGGTLWDRSVFSVINLANGDSIEFTYVLTAHSGG